MEPNERDYDLAHEVAGYFVEFPHSAHIEDIAKMLARYRAELTSDDAVLRRSEEILRAAGIFMVRLGPVGSRDLGGREIGATVNSGPADWRTLAKREYPQASGASLAEAVAALKVHEP